MTAIQAADIALRLEDDRPKGVEHHGRSWRVIDTPTRIGNESAVYSALITHPPVPWIGWRFMARADDDGEVLTFDVRRRGDSWDLITTYR